MLRLIDQGRSNGQIASALFISAKTVDHHISAILDKLDAGSRGEAAAIARNAGADPEVRAWPSSSRIRKECGGSSAEIALGVT